MQRSETSADDSASPFSDAYILVAEANRRNYTSNSSEYIKHTECVIAADAQRALTDHIKEAIRVRGPVDHPLRALDACGGAGNAALKMQELGCTTTLADISPELIEHYRHECDKRGFDCDAKAGEIGSFFLETEEQFDLIFFSSALHHLEDPSLVIKLAADRLAPGGVIASIFDPCPLSPMASIVTEPLRILTRAFRNPKLIVTRCGAITRRILRRKSNNVDVDSVQLTHDNIGLIAEYHGRSGLNDDQLVKQVEATTLLRNVLHSRYIGHVSGPAKLWLALLHSPNRFTLIFQAPT